jgi:hypothetical protein
MIQSSSSALPLLPLVEGAGTGVDMPLKNGWAAQNDELLATMIIHHPILGISILAHALLNTYQDYNKISALVCVLL